MFTFSLFNLLKNSLSNPLLDIKNTLIIKITSPTGARVADINDAIVILPVATERTTKFI